MISPQLLIRAGADKEAVGSIGDEGVLRVTVTPEAVVAAVHTLRTQEGDSTPEINCTGSPIEGVYVIFIAR